jgi:hypothetical protein
MNSGVADSKNVASRTATEPLPRVNSTVLKGDATTAVRALKKQPRKDLLILGSGSPTLLPMPARSKLAA